MGLRCWCFRIISTGLSRSSSKYAFRRTTKKNLGGISTYISTSLPSWCSFLATEPKRRKEVMPKVFCSSSAWETMRAMYSSLVYIFTILAFLMLLPLQGVKLIALIPRALPWARSFCPFRACGGKVSKVPLHRPCGTSRVSCRSFLLWISSPCLHLLAQIHNKNPL